MTLGEKIRQVRKRKNMSLRDLEKRLKDTFGEEALRYNTLYRIEKGLRDPRVSSLSQICLGLGVSLKELKEGTNEERSSLIDFVQKTDKTARYMYSEKAYAQILTAEARPFLALRLVLEPGAQTKPERDPTELGKFEKWIYGLKGDITCVVNQDRFIVKKDDVLCFKSNLPHYFENNTQQKAVGLLIQNPRHI